ncbi:pantothenate kinase domain protein [Mycobacterium xenopi 3993]|nr:pantothenate kinase domain protein [Mycobacterium xenopi 3993]
MRGSTTSRRSPPPGNLAFDQPTQPGGEHPAHPAAATLVLRKDADHSINRLRLRKL